MIVFSHLNTPSKHGLDQRLYGLSGVGNVPRELWVVLELEWSPRTPPAEFRKDRLTSFQPHPLLFLFLNLCSSPISILPFFLASAAASFNPIFVFPFFFQSHLRLSLLLGCGLSLSSGGGCLACCSFVYRML